MNERHAQSRSRHASVTPGILPPSTRPSEVTRALLDVCGVLLGVAGASPEKPEVTGNAYVVRRFAVAFAAHGVEVHSHPAQARAMGLLK